MQELGARTVFFVRDAEQALRFYTETLGFSVDWCHREAGRAFVCQVSLLGLQLILNQAEDWTRDRPGHGRLFVGVDDDVLEPFQRHLRDKKVKSTVFNWGEPTLVIHDLDENELFFWLPENERASLKAPPGDT